MKSIYVGLLAGAVSCAFIQTVSAIEIPKATVLYSFCSQQNCTDGTNPYANLLDLNGTLYGTTYDGGVNNGDTVFGVDPNTGVETTLYSFCSQRNCKDGEYPYAGLIEVNGMLYGTTRNGGAHSSGAVFAIDPNSGTETITHAFSSTDGYAPVGGLVAVKGALYGTTELGGAHGDGVVFKINPNTGAEKVLYSFCAQQNCADGANPEASLIDVNGTLYGTTSYGGYSTCQYGCGVAFSVDQKTGAETVLYTFCSRQNCTDGRYPAFGSLLNVSGTLYGTTQLGGSNNDGTAFKIDSSTGAETVLYSFCSQTNCTDGSEPLAGMIIVKGTLYGTTSGGGTGSFGDGGTVFSLDPTTGAETMIYSLCNQKNCSHGEYPNASLIDVNGTLYGTAYYGGAYFGGTVFAIKK